MKSEPATSEVFDVIVIGGGAAGLFCAAEAAKRGRRTVVLEHSERVGKKIAISGGGRCNFTNLNSSAASFLSANPHFAKSALARYTPSDFVALVEKHGIAYHEKKSGQLFCDGSAVQIIEMLLAECAAGKVEVRCDFAARQITRDADLFRVDSSRGWLAAQSLVIATGGLSIPPLGATDFGYRIARQFELRIVAPRPGLVPFKLEPALQKKLEPLSGVSVEAIVKCAGAEFQENILVTHRGFSGPAILQISSYWESGEPVTINLLPHQNVEDLLLEHRSSEIELSNLLSRYLPRRFAHAWCDLYAPSKPMRQFSLQQLQAIAELLNAMTIVPAGTEGYRKAEVTAGGVSTAELSSKTMESKRVPGLYFIGEVVDVTGHLGGHNFQWAWSSAFAAGQVA